MTDLTEQQAALVNACEKAWAEAWAARAPSEARAAQAEAWAAWDKADAAGLRYNYDTGEWEADRE